VFKWYYYKTYSIQLYSHMPNIEAKEHLVSDILG